MACLDTCVILDLRGRAPEMKARARWKLAELRSRGERLVVSRFTWAEVYTGVSRTDDPLVEEARLRAAMGALPVLEFDDRAARLFGSLTANLFRQGRPAGDLDVLIAATALAAGHSVLTRDIEHFARMPGLVVETY
jgi:tRNA(fMet)-specific endonuclease VapC